MPVQENINRNKQIFELHRKNFKVYSFAELGRMFKIDRSTVCKIFRRYEKRLVDVNK
ncbi:MAG: hypothetical protein NTZ18_03575 [Candidatus Komeilibacteria bacterium]|nr:hypothetical protein [Candidatus Komeilibacteria bacterium]